MRSEAVVAELGARRRGIVRSADAVAAGLDLDDLHHLRARRGLLVPLGRGIDRLRDRPFDWESRCQAALDLAGDDAVLGLRSAARLHGFYVYRASPAVEVLTARSRDHRTSVGRLVQTRLLPMAHVTLIDGFPTTTPGRTFFDLCGDPDPGLNLAQPYHHRQMARVYNDALGRRGMTFTQEAAVLSVLARRGRSGTRLVREILLRFGPEHEPTRSDVESLFLEVMVANAVPAPEQQAAISGVDGWIATVDFVWRPARHIVEVDSRWHDGPLDREHDAERDRRLAAAGFTVARYRYGELVQRPASIAREVLAAISTPPSP